ncbi:MAG: hypothetical protein HN846_05005 [Candidatus Pacebacteria bacterium]|jgi:hypothetical protein|nr:hypothetical protein [Candidatus Paceibacterota bacterium]MBT4004776.1 hypothetical protein [Candidatus Paceibacterota bacterium]MBT7184133.1 hypothetical protein [Candidatus Paceibacterota bacterium]MBT7310035.1 hypothetical protein [Candidatus Paceibacterota bacterium]
MFDIKNIIRKSSKLGLNYLDVSVIVLAAMIVASFLFFRSQKKDQWLNVSVVVANDELWWYGDNSPYWYVNDLEIGDLALNSLGVMVGEIADVLVIDVGGPQKKALVSLKLKVTYDKTKNNFIFNYKPLEIGRSLNLTFNNSNVRGFVTSISTDEEFSQQMYDKHVLVSIKNIKSDYVPYFQPGLTMTDSFGREIAVIEDVVKVENSVGEFFSDIRGQIVKTRSLLSKDIVLQLKIKTFKSRELYYFMDGAAIKLAERIWIHFPNIVANDAEIIKILE